MGLSRLFYKNTLVDVIIRNERFCMGLEYDGFPVTFTDTIERWTELEPLRKYFPGESASTAEIQIHQLVDFLQLIYNLQSSCAKIKKIQFNIRPEVRRARVLNAPPADFTCTWRWRNGFLSLDYGADIVELQGGWYRKGDAYWRYPLLSEKEIVEIRRKRIEKSELLEFLTRDLPTYEKASVNCACELSHSTIPALSLRFETVERDHVRIEQTWNVPPESVDSDFDLFGYVVADRTLRPGMRPTDLRSHLSFDRDFASLEGLEIARFSDRHYASVKPWLVNTASFEKEHPWIDPPYEWILAAHEDLTHGVGKAIAAPLAHIGGEEFTIDGLRELMREPYAHLVRGWVRRADLLTLGIGTDGKWMEKGRFTKVTLSPTQIICRGDAHINGPWTRLELRGTAWASSSQKQVAAREHLRFLTDWGISGGLAGGFESAVVYGSHMATDLLARENAARVLFVGSRTDIEEYMSSMPTHQIVPLSEYDEHSVNRAYCVAHEALSRSTTAQTVSWDLLVLIEPDVLYLDESRAAFRAIRELNASCRIGFFVKCPLTMGDDARPLQKLVLKLNAKDDVFSRLIQDPRQLMPLPAPYVFRNEPSIARDEGFDVVLQGMPSSGTPIPPRPSVPPVAARVEVSYRQIPAKVQMSQSMSSEAFIREARKMATVGGAGDAEHVPFACYWPKYSDMNTMQKKWYYHLRGLIRRGQYPDTDLSYLFVHIYELLNGIGSDSPADAYKELMAIWMNYRERHPKLDKYLEDWIFDFLMLRKTGDGVQSFVEAAPSVPKEAVELVLTARNPDELLLLPIQTLEILTGYGIRQSKFYLAGYREIVEKILPRAVALVDRRMRDMGEKGILDKARRRTVTAERFAFASAVVERAESYQITYVPYADNLECRDLINQILRYAENSLRTRFGFTSKLRGVTLDSKYAAWIDAYLERQFQKKIATQQPKPTSRVALDTGAIDKLRGESDEVRDALIASMEQAPATEETKQTELDDFVIPERPSDAPEGLLTDLAPVSRILHAITREQNDILSFFRETGWEAEADQFVKNFAGLLIEAEVDTINGLAIHHLGVQLVEREDDRLVVADDYRDELEYLMDHPQERKESAWEAIPEGLEPEWLTFFADADLDALGAVLEGNGALEVLASVRNALPDLMIDALNAAAMETIGDLLVDGNAIAEDYLAIVTEHLRKVG